MIEIVQYIKNIIFFIITSVITLILAIMFTVAVAFMKASEGINYQTNITMDGRLDREVANISVSRGRNDSFVVAKGVRSYINNRDYLYAYGRDEFTVINLHNGDTEIFFKKDLSEEKKEYIKSQLNDAREEILVNIKISDESELDNKTHSIMKFLENEVTDFPMYKRIDLDYPQK